MTKKIATQPLRVESKTFQIICGDCLDVMASMESNSIDSIVTDPPHGLSPISKDWDFNVPGIPFWKQVLRVAKPGAYLLSFGGTRTFHRLMVAIEDAGWEIRDTIMWVYGSGFPKSQSVAIAVGKKLDAISNRIKESNSNSLTKATRKWKGWGTALKPAWEPVVVARKPFRGTVADNVLKYSTGALNIDECRVTRGRFTGRWPANLIHDGSDEVTRLLPNDSQRFFYCAKASEEERNEGLEEKKRDEVKVDNLYNKEVKPITLMRYLVRLVTPPNGVVLDPFCGSGNTGIAAIMEDFRFIGIDASEEYCKIAKRRIGAKDRVKNKTPITHEEKTLGQTLPLFKGGLE